MDQENTSSEEARRARYQSVRDGFNRMALDDRAMFLVEAAFTTVAKAVDEAGQQVTEMVSRVNEACREQAKSTGAEGPAEGPAEPSGSGNPSMN